VVRLSESDASALLDFVSAAERFEDVRSFQAGITALLRGLVQCDSAAMSSKDPLDPAFGVPDSNQLAIPPPVRLGAPGTFFGGAEGSTTPEPVDNGRVMRVSPAALDAGGHEVASVDVALVRLDGGAKAAARKRATCSWHVLYSRATNRAGISERSFTREDRNRTGFRVKRRARR
jgi:hypothetical protein